MQSSAFSSFFLYPVRPSVQQYTRFQRSVSPIHVRQMPHVEQKNSYPGRRTSIRRYANQPHGSTPAISCSALSRFFSKFCFWQENKNSHAMFSTLLELIDKGLIEKAEIDSGGVSYWPKLSSACSNNGSPNVAWWQRKWFPTPSKQYSNTKQYVNISGVSSATQLILERLCKGKVPFDFVRQKFNLGRFLVEKAWLWMPPLVGLSVYSAVTSEDDAGKMHGTGVLTDSQTKTKFSDIAGIEYAKIKVTEIMDMHKNPEKYTKMGARPPRGVLVVGPPGTGKTMLARAMANEVNMPFIYSTGSDFVEVYAGRGASRVRNMFEKARQLAPCVLFIDEIDALGKSRPTKKQSAGSKWSNNDETGNEEEYVQTLNALLSCMDGLDSHDHDILVMAATNRYSVLDSALTRPGRFDRVLELHLPNLQGRMDILKLYAQKTGRVSSDISLKQIAEDTVDLSPADLELVVNEAAITAITQHDFDSAVMNVLSRTNVGSGNQKEYDFTESDGSNCLNPDHHHHHKENEKTTSGSSEHVRIQDDT